jgi:Malectin-like domain
MQTAATSASTGESLDFSWSADNKSTIFYAVLYFSEIQSVVSPAFREFDVLSDGYLNATEVPQALYTEWLSYIHTGNTEYYLSLVATSNSTLPPLLNALELYILIPATGLPTYSGDGKFDHLCYWSFNLFLLVNLYYK